MDKRSDFLQAQRVSKVYGHANCETMALRNVSLTISESEILAITGASGSGKSTLLNVLSGLDAPSLGKVLYKGADLRSLRRKDRTQLRLSEMGFVFQFFNLIPNLTAFDNAILPAILAKRSDKVDFVDKLFKAAGLKEKKSSTPAQLSGGEQQRVAIIRAMVNKPRIIFADEPTGNLDSKTGDQIFDLLLEQVKLNKQALVYVTHNPGLTQLADRRIEMRDGEIHGGTSDQSGIS